MAKIVGNTVGVPNPQSDWDQTDATKADFIKNKPDIQNGEDGESVVINKENVYVVSFTGEKKLLADEETVDKLMPEKEQPFRAFLRWMSAVQCAPCNNT